MAYEDYLYNCFTYPCRPSGPQSAIRPRSQPAGFGTVELNRSLFDPAPTIYEQVLANTLRPDPDQFNYEAHAREQAAQVARLPVFTIPDAEHLEIDAAIQEQELRAERIEQLAEFRDTIHPDRLLDIAGNIAEGQYTTVPLPPRPVAPPVLVLVEPEPPPRTEEPTGYVPTPSVGPPVFLGGLVPAAREAQPDIYEAEPEGEPMADLSDILGGLSQVADIYATVQQARAPTPYAQPAPPAPGYEGSVRDWIDGPFDFLEPTASVTSLPTTGGTMAGYSGGCISNRDRQIAAASGVSAEAVDRVLHYARQGRRRRRRMLTKSDIGDISTMKSILGNGEAFKMWLAKATR